MTDDLLALARDVDRLFRARQDGRQMPVGEACLLLDRTGLYERRLPRWIADMAEWRPKLLDGLLADLGFSVEPMPLVAADKSLFRTRRHVAMIALTEPDHFERCLAEIDVRGDWPIDSDEPEPCRFMARNVRMAAGMRARGAIAVVKHYRYPAKKEAADIARTAAYLADLKERLRLYREAHPPAANNVGPDCDHHVSAWTEANGDAAILADFG